MKKILFIAVLSFFCTALFSQTITGKITDGIKGTPLAGASLSVKATGAKAIAGADGVFTIRAKPGDVLLVTNVGYKDYTVTVGNEQTLDIAMEPGLVEIGQVVVLGSRRGGRVQTETAVPVDVIKIGHATMPTGRMDLTSLLSYVAPSYNYNKQSGSDGADHLDLASLRGLSPDQTLVLINGKRRHQTALVAVFGTRGRGASGTDMNAIPMASIDRVEILRDGASAQYGSDAIAGVINLILKKDTKKLTGDVGYSGYYDHKFNPYFEDKLHNQYLYHGAVDGQTFAANLNYGLPLGHNGGFVNFTGNFTIQGKTFRQVLDTSYDAAILLANKETLPISPYRRANGEGSVTAGGVFYNLEVPFANSKTTLYSFGGYNQKSSDAYAFTRYWTMWGGQFAKFPTNPDGSLIFVPGIMHSTPLPDGLGGGLDTVYTPHIQTHINDISGSLGIRGTTTGNWDWDISNTTGRNNFHYYGDKTFNVSSGSVAQTHFDDGGFNLLQSTTNADISKEIKGVAEGLHLGFGAEYRFEQYQIYKGELASYEQFDPTKSKLPGAQGYPGYKPSDEVKANRNVVGIYGDAELDVTKAFLVDVAVRLENYSDFGFTSNYKLATRYKATSNFNLRGSVSTGFRAPSLAQINFSNVFSNVTGGSSYYVLIAPNSGDLAKAIGLPELKQEKSINASLGFSWKPMQNFTVTVDGYLVKIKDRVVLSGVFDTAVAALKTYYVTHPEIAHAQFFTNAVHTTNYGIDIVLDYRTNFSKNQHINALLAANFQKAKIDKINIPAAFNDNELHRQLFYSPREQGLLTASAPPSKITGNLEYGINKFSIGVRETYFGKISLFGQGNADYSPPFGVAPIPTDDFLSEVPDIYHYKGKGVTDLYFSYKLCKSATLFLGADNIFNVHPTIGIVQVAKQNDIGDTESGGPWDAVQMGINGTRFFTRLAFNF